MKYLFILVFAFLPLSVFCNPDAQSLINSLNVKFKTISDYKANVNMKFNIPGVKMNSMDGKIFFKQPDRLKIRTKGIYFLPKQHPLQGMQTLLKNTSSYTSVISGYETFAGKKCALVNVIPLNAGTEIVLAKLWVDVASPTIYKTQVTTKSNGTVESVFTYGSNQNQGLPSKLEIIMEVNKIKVPKMIAADLNKKSTKTGNSSKLPEKGTITIFFTNYEINTKFDNAVFNE